MQLFRSPFASVPVTFRSNYSVQESISRLHEGTSRRTFLPSRQEVVIGNVSEGKVRLYRITPGYRNSFRPIFTGRFVEKESHTELQGKFAIHWAVRIFMTYWFGFALFWTVVAGLMIWTKPDPHWDAPFPQAVVPLFGLAFFFFGIIFFNFCWWLSRRDITRITSVIEEALSKKSERRL